MSDVKILLIDQQLVGTSPKDSQNGNIERVSNQSEQIPVNLNSLTMFCHDDHNDDKDDTARETHDHNYDDT